jgi:AbrB family looped-hinge helix DNA binding protein
MDPTTLTSKCQVTVPKEVRERVGLKPGDKVVFTVLSNGTIIMRPKRGSILDLVGLLNRPDQPHIRIEEMTPDLGEVD